MYIPDCDRCEHYSDCVVRKALKEARETIFNIGREKARRDTFIHNGKLVKSDKEDRE